MAKQKTVTVVNPDGAEAQVLPASVKLYKRLGWTLKEESLEAPEGEAQLSERDKAQLEVASKVEAGDSAEGNQERQAPIEPVLEQDGSGQVEVVDNGAAGQPSDNGNSGESDVLGRNKRSR